MRFVLDCISDTHTQHAGCVFPPPALEAGDVWILLHGGDFSIQGHDAEIEAFRAWLAAQPHARKVVIAGNHDLSFERYTLWNRRRFLGAGDEAAVGEAREALAHLSSVRILPPFRGSEVFAGVADYLEGTSVTIEGLRIFGSPYSLRFFDWAFQLDSPEDARALWATIPEGTHVALVHGPPRGLGDECPDMKDRSKLVHVGDAALLERLRALRPPLCVYGHIHEGFGVHRDEGSDTTFVNASSLDGRYTPHGRFVRVVLDARFRVERAEVLPFVS